MTRTFVLTNHKGGVGKSTSATNIALGIAGVLRRGGAPNCRVLLIDTDNQGHGRAVSTRPDTCPHRTLKALKRALASGHCPLIHHSDQRLQYACKDYTDLLKAEHV